MFRMAYMFCCTQAPKQQDELPYWLVAVLGSLGALQTGYLTWVSFSGIAAWWSMITVKCAEMHCILILLGGHN